MVEGDIETVDWLNWLDVCVAETPRLRDKSLMTGLGENYLRLDTRSQKRKSSKHPDPKMVFYEKN